MTCNCMSIQIWFAVYDQNAGTGTSKLIFHYYLISQLLIQNHDCKRSHETSDTTQLYCNTENSLFNFEFSSDENHHSYIPGFKLGWEIFQYYRHFAILGCVISVSQTFSHTNNITCAIYRRILCHISPNTSYYRIKCAHWQTILKPTDSY